MTKCCPRDAVGLADDPLSQRTQNYYQENAIGGKKLKDALEHGVANL